MSELPINLEAEIIKASKDLSDLKRDGWSVRVVDCCLLVSNIPYLSEDGTCKMGTFGCSLNLAGYKTCPPSCHKMYWIGDCPHDAKQMSLKEELVVGGVPEFNIAGDLHFDFAFSQKPISEKGNRNYFDFKEKVEVYADIVSQPVKELGIETKNVDGHSIEIAALIPQKDSHRYFEYDDANAIRAGITSVGAKLRTEKIAIVGLGGTGSYILDQVSKCQVKEIHLYDDDIVENHNAFRMPGAMSFDELLQIPHKVNYWAEVYGKVHRGIKPHAEAITDSNVASLMNMDFVFLAMDSNNENKPLIVTELEKCGKDFIDTGIGIDLENDKITGLIRTTPRIGDRSVESLPKECLGGINDDNHLYGGNIQICELNALNAIIAVIEWKKSKGFYDSLEEQEPSLFDVETGTMVTTQ